MSAREAARTAPTLEALRALLEKFDGCALKFTATRLVFADGNPQARIMFVGEAPGREEDIEGLPFVGRSGKLLDRMIAAIGLDRSNAYIANVIPWRPPGNRTPTPQETQICLPFIQRQIELVNPDVLVTLGNPSTQTLLSTREGIMRTRGRWFDYDTGTRMIRAIATFHPAYLLRSPSYKRHGLAGSARDRQSAGAGEEFLILRGACPPRDASKRDSVIYFCRSHPTFEADMNEVVSSAAMRQRVIWSSTIGNALEWFDFAIFGAFAAIIGQHFSRSRIPARACYRFMDCSVSPMSRDRSAVLCSVCGRTALAASALLSPSC